MVGQAVRSRAVQLRRKIQDLLALVLCGVLLGCASASGIEAQSQSSVSQNVKGFQIRPVFFDDESEVVYLKVDGSNSRIEVSGMDVLFDAGIEESEDGWSISNTFIEFSVVYEPKGLKWKGPGGYYHDLSEIEVGIDGGNEKIRLIGFSPGETDVVNKLFMYNQQLGLFSAMRISPMSLEDLSMNGLKMLHITDLEEIRPFGLGARKR